MRHLVGSMCLRMEPGSEMYFSIIVQYLPPGIDFWGIFFFYPYKGHFYNYLNTNCFGVAFYVKHYLTGYFN